MDEARRLLMRPDMSITEIGLQCGYGNPSNFPAAISDGKWAPHRAIFAPTRARNSGPWRVADIFD
jgi:AraC-like DNA-binding protein